MQTALDIERRSQNANQAVVTEKPKSGSKLSALTALVIAFVFLMVGAFFGRSKPAVAGIAEPIKAADVIDDPFAPNVTKCTKPKAGEKKACDGKKKKDL